MNCTLSTLGNSVDGFNFDDLFAEYTYLNQTCPTGSDIFFKGSRMLTYESCRIITNTSNSIWTGWSAYPIEDIWTRIVTWKLPLFQLAVQFPRAPLGFHVETLTVVHLLGDPIDSIVCALVTLAMCHARANSAKRICEALGIGEKHPEYTRTWKSLALMMVSYDECGKSDAVGEFQKEYFASRQHAAFESDLRHIYEETADSLAADRATKSLPVFVAELIFMGGWVIALIKAASSEPSATNWPNVEVHSVAFSGMYLWIASTVVIGSVIGATQTEGSIPRLLQAFEYSIAQLRGDTMRRPSSTYREEHRWCMTGKERAIEGGMANWRPRKWRHRWTSLNISNWAMASFVAIALLIVSTSYFTAIILSNFVPPQGLNCRQIPQSIMLVVWLCSFVLECVFELWLPHRIFWPVLIKDLIAAHANIGIIITTQWGVMNSCACWSQWGMTGLHLPQMTNVKPELMHYTRNVAPYITFMAILFQLVFCAVVACQYWDAVRVFIQRDDGLSNREGQKRKTSRLLRDPQ